MRFCCVPIRRVARLEVLAERYLDRKLGAAAEQHADLAITLAERLAPEIDQQGFREIYETIDLPLAGCWRAWSRPASAIDPAQLRVLSGQLDTEIQRLSARSMSWPASRSTSIRRSSSARFCSKT